MKKVLLGTTNPAKIKKFESLLSGYAVSFCTPESLDICGEPEEDGASLEENAIRKAKFYGQYFDAVICNDRGLYFEELALEDVRQPGLHVRSPLGGRRLNEEEMIAYYAKLSHSLGGKILAYYVDAMAVYHQNAIYTFRQDDAAAKCRAFYITDKPSPKRRPGWPLDSISLYRHTGAYFVDEADDQGNTETESAILEAYRERLIQFLVSSLQLCV